MLSNEHHFPPQSLCLWFSKHGGFLYARHHDTVACAAAPMGLTKQVGLCVCAWGGGGGRSSRRIINHQEPVPSQWTDLPVQMPVLLLIFHVTSGNLLNLSISFFICEIRVSRPPAWGGVGPTG